MALTDQEQASVLTDVKEGFGYVSTKNTRARTSLGRAIEKLDVAVPPSPMRVVWTVPIEGGKLSGQIDEAKGNGRVTVTPEPVSVGFYVDGALVNTQTTAPWSLVWDTTSIINGSYVLKATAVDAAGDTASAEITVTVDNAVTPPPPPPGDGYMVPGTGAVVRQDLAPDANFAVVWDHANPGPSSRIVHHTSGGDPHPLIDGTVNPNWREMICQPGDKSGGDPSDTSRMQMGANVTSMPPGAFVAQNGECWAIYWSLRVPQVTDTQIWELFQQPKSVFMQSFALTPSGDIELHSRTDGGSKPTTWKTKAPLNTWMRFALPTEFKRGSGKTRLWGELTGDPSKPLAPLSDLITHPTMASSGNQSALHSGVYSHKDPSRKIALHFANWQFARFDPAKF